MAGFTPVNAVRRPPPGAASTQDSKGKESQHISGGKSVDKTVNARSAGNGSSTTTTYPTHHVNPYIYPQQRSRAYPPLDMASVRKRSDGLQTVVKTDRPFGLTEAPTFYPTLEEFGDPAAYLEKIAPRGKKFGMAKIVPPKGWDPPFCLDTEMFWFKTKRQSMNPTLAERAEKAFVDSLYYFHRHTNKTPINRLPSIDKRPLDLFHLHQCVQLRGGFTEVCRRKLWAQIGRELGYTGKIMTSLSTSLKHSYQKVIYPFDQYLERNSVGLLADGIRIPMFEAPDETSEENNSNEEQEQVSLPQKREHPDDDSDERSGATKKHKLENGTKVARRVRGDERRASQVKNSEATLHRVVPYSDTPSIPDDPTIPPFDNWHGGINTIGDPSDNLTAPTYNLRQFQQKAALFKDKYFQPILGDKPKLEEEDVEREFWRILSDPTENIQVEYGTDIHTSVQSSGFPQIERDVTNRYSQDPWNLNVLPFVHKALSRYVDADVSYLVQPFLHIGMVFSSKSWHFEDFYSYAFNYHHFGEAKTYYSVPEDQTEKLRELLTEIIGKDNIDQDPSLLLQPNHMLSPELLIQRGIICHALDQRAGQFVVTFPKAYTSHVNYGFNMTESVNFFPAFDWLDYGLQCASLYQQFNYPPPFSIQRLLLTTSATSHNINIAKL
ncbi:hypothetical protein TRICI_004165 [Trichomonascus ciferrii]|uniref:ARID domain-containing protein n=1 Tax=Trichomonascus ciferrii TaxID=44093 RepID=A0A642V1Q4_9ASCO|nr:hypothetical protein TRICI_004165 [Trichomonascus ciferrii]